MVERPDIEQLLACLASYRQLPPSRRRPPTLLHVAGVGHLEDIASNILGFFLSPTAEHGLGPLFLDALLHLLGAAHPYDVAAVQVEREVLTPEGKRLDLVIDTGEVVIAIEHKINHQPINPFATYAAHLRSLAQGRPWHGILLAPHLITPTPALHQFRPLTFRAFYDAVEAHHDQFLADGREPYPTLYRDFVATMRNPNQERSMDRRHVSFLAEHRLSLEALLTDIDKLQRHLSKQLVTLQQRLDISTFTKPITSGFTTPRLKLYQILFYRLPVAPDIELQVNVNYSPDGWRINLMDPVADHEAGLARLSAWCTANAIVVRRREVESPTVLRLGYGSDSLAFGADLELVREEVQGLLDQVRRATAAGLS